MTVDYSWLVWANTPGMIGVRRNFPDKDSSKNMHVGAAPLIISTNQHGFEAKRLRVTGPKGAVWVKAAPLFEPAQGDYILDSFNVAIAVKRQVGEKQQRIVVVGDADFLSNLRGQGPADGVNYLAWMSNESYPIVLPGKKPTDVWFRISLTTAIVQKWVLIWIVSAIVLIIGAIVLVRRKRQ